MISPEVRKKEISMKFEPIVRENFECLIDTKTYPQDKFAKTFVAKAKTMKLWNRCVAAIDEDTNEIMGAIIVSFSKRQPVVANLQLLHTFYRHRGKGVGGKLCQWAFEHAQQNHADFFRVSAEPDAVEFYKKIGFEFLGKQKSGSQLSMCLIKEADSFSVANYDINNPYIQKAVLRKGKGGCVEFFKEVKPRTKKVSEIRK